MPYFSNTHTCLRYFSRWVLPQYKFTLMSSTELFFVCPSSFRDGIIWLFFCTLWESTGREDTFYFPQMISVLVADQVILFFLQDLWSLISHCIPELLLVHMGFQRTSVIPPRGWSMTGQCFGRTLQGIPGALGGCQDTPCKLSSIPLFGFTHCWVSGNVIKRVGSLCRVNNWWMFLSTGQGTTSMGKSQ